MAIGSAWLDAVVDGRKVLRKAGFNPPDEHVLIELTHPGSQSRGLDEDISIARGEVKAFRAFKSDRTYNFTVDDVGYEWGEEAVAVAELREIAGVAEDRALILEREDEPDIELPEDGALSLRDRGTERVRTRKRKVTVSYNHEPYELDRRIYTTEELMALFAVTTGYILDLVKPNGEFDELKPGQRINVRDGMEFVSHAPCGQSS